MGLHFYQYIEVASFVIACAYSTRLWSSVYWLFIPYLGIVVFVDVVAPNLSEQISKDNHWLYNLYLPFQYFFFATVMKNEFVDVRMQRMFFFTSILYLCFYIINIFWLQGFKVFNTDSFLLSSLILLFTSGCMFLDLMRNDRGKGLYSLPIFWFALSCMIFFVGFSLLVSGFFFYLDSEEAYIEHRKIYEAIRTYVNIVHYSLLMLTIVLIKKANG